MPCHWHLYYRRRSSVCRRLFNQMLGWPVFLRWLCIVDYKRCCSEMWSLLDIWCFRQPDTSNKWFQYNSIHASREQAGRWVRRLLQPEYIWWDVRVILFSLVCLSYLNWPKWFMFYPATLFGVVLLALQYIPRYMHTGLLCFALLWLCNRS